MVWLAGRDAADYTVETSDDGRAWQAVLPVTGSDAGRDNLYLPESDSRWLRLSGERPNSTALYRSMDDFMVLGFWLMILTMFQIRPALFKAPSYSRLKAPRAFSRVITLIQGMGLENPRYRRPAGSKIGPATDGTGEKVSRSIETIELMVLMRDRPSAPPSTAAERPTRASEASAPVVCLTRPSG